MYCDVTNNQNMIYIQFADIPPVEVRTILKKNKWWWSPSRIAWQKYDSKTNREFAQKMKDSISTELIPAGKNRYKYKVSFNWREDDISETLPEEPQNHPVLTEEEIDLVERFMPTNQFIFCLHCIRESEEKDFFIDKFKSMAKTISEMQQEQGESKNIRLHFFSGGYDCYVLEWDGNDELFTFGVLDGNTDFGDYGYVSLSELKRLPGMEIDFHFDEISVENWLEKQQTRDIITERKSEIIAKEAAEIEIKDIESDPGEIKHYKDIILLEEEKENGKDNPDLQGSPVSEIIERDDRRRTETLLSEEVQNGGNADHAGELRNDLPATRKRTQSVKKNIKEIREKCRQILKKSDSEITSEDKKILAQYEGAGGLGEENASASGVLSEFYTPKKIVKAVWMLADHYAPNAKTVLEPTAGIGRFADNRPKNSFILHEQDETAARIAAILHPNAKIINAPFQAQFFDETQRVHQKNHKLPQFDLVIGNPPYGVYSDKWKGLGEGTDHNRYEEYFIDKGLDSLSDKGLLAFVVPSGFLRTKQDKIKEKIAEKGNLIDAYRLPNKAFPTTEVGTDIIIIRKEKGRVEDFCNDKFFLRNRDKILGSEIMRSGRFGEEPYVVIPEGETLDSLLRNNIVLEENRFTITQPTLFDEISFSKPVTVKQPVIQSPSPAPEQQTPTANSEIAECMDIRQFCEKYGKEFNPTEQELWLATSYNGFVDCNRISAEAFEFLHSGNSSYIEALPSKWIHRELYVTGNIEDKLNELESLHQKSYISDELYSRNQKILKAALPEKIKMKDIFFSPATQLAREFYIEDSIYAKGRIPLLEEFRLWVSGIAPDEMKSSYSYYTIDYTTSPVAREDFPPDCQWYDVLAYLDGTPVRARRSWDEEGKKAAALEAEKKRIARRETADKLFNRFIHEGLSEETTQKLENEWNKRFNAYIAPDYSKLPLYVDGMASGKGKIENFTLYDQQIKGISFLCNKGNGLLAYDVGVGKTASGIVATVNQIQTGRSLRPLIVVPKSVYSKWVNDFKDFFPNIQINALGNFSDDLLSQYRTDNYGLSIPEGSVSICTNEALQKISFTDESIETALMSDFSNLLGIETSFNNDRERAEATERISKEIGFASQTKEGFVFWERTGFDHVTVDEAHRYKNLFRVPRSSDKRQANEYAGLGSGKPSSRALKLYAITQLTQRNNNDRNVFLLTATPFTNSPLEVYSMMSYIARKKLQEMHIYNIKDFLNEYAEMKTEWAVSPKGDIQPKQVMKNFRSLKSLQNFLGEYIDKVDAEEAGVLRPRKITHVQDLNPTELQKKIIARETARMTDPKSIRNGGVLVAMNNMRMAMLSPALVNANDYDFELPPIEQLVESSPKLTFVCDSVADCYKEIPDGGQIIYMPRGVDESVIVKNYLVKKGIPENAIALLNSSTTSNQKDAITNAFNDPENPLKIIIGSETIAEGVDLNGNSYALYNTMLGWNPTETVQVEGRIWRQGNRQGHTHIIYPLMNDSIDSLMYQKHDEKSSRINALWSYKGDKLNVEDINPEELKFDLIKDPLVKADYIISQKTADKIRDRQILQGKITTICDLEEKKEELEHKLAVGYAKPYHKDQLKNTIKKLENFGIEFTGNNDRKDIRCRITEIKSEVENINDQLATIESGKNELVEELTKQELKRQIVLPPNDEIQKELSQSILTNLKSFGEIKEELKKEMETKQKPKEVKKDFGIGE